MSRQTALVAIEDLISAIELKVMAEIISVTDDLTKPDSELNPLAVRQALVANIGMMFHEVKKRVREKS